VLGGYPENPDILTRYHLGHHFCNPLDIKNFDIRNDILIFFFLFFENTISRASIKSMLGYGHEGI
jgi:hypothetical protein